jgi:manganese oxidase
MNLLKLIVVSAALISSIIIVIGITGTTTFSFNQSSVSGQGGLKKDMVGGHTPGYNLLRTSGDVLDPNSVIATKDAVVDPMKYLRQFNYGRVSTLPNGTTLREFTLVASDDKVKEISPGIFYNVWTFNGTVPGPTLRATEGDLIRVHFINNGSKFHSIHFHGIHPAGMDGVFEGIGPGGGKFTYEFTAEPFGVFPYHCHMEPLEEHIAHGLYGVYIVDPKTPRPPADEMVMMMNGYDTDSDRENNFYTVDGIPYYFMHHPIQIEKNRLIRVYLVNMLEFDPINNFHLHANMYHLYRSGTSLVPDEYTDLVTMSQGERGILEFKYKFPGQYMFHAHKTEFAEKGWMGSFLVKDSTLGEQDAGRDNIVGNIKANSTTITTPSIHLQNSSKINLRVGGLEGN